MALASATLRKGALEALVGMQREIRGKGPKGQLQSSSLPLKCSQGGRGIASPVPRADEWVRKGASTPGSFPARCRNPGCCPERRSGASILRPGAAGKKCTLSFQSFPPMRQERRPLIEAWILLILPGQDLPCCNASIEKGLSLPFTRQGPRSVWKSNWLPS